MKLEGVSEEHFKQHLDTGVSVITYYREQFFVINMAGKIKHHS